MNKCPSCGANCEKEYCWKHSKKKALKKVGNRKSRSPKYPKFKEALKSYIDKRNDFFLGIWTRKPHRCEVTGANLGKEPNSMYFHHILAKNKYPEAEFDEENIVILHPNIHANVEINMYRYEEINNKRETLKTKYNLS